MTEHEAKPALPGRVGPAAAARVIEALLREAGDDQGEGPGARIDGFVLCSRLGEGGGGVVYRGFREGSDRPLAIKVLHKRVAHDQASGKRAWRELELLASVRLPALPRLIDYGLHEGRLYVATEFVEGLALDRHCEERGLDRRARVALLARVADAVQSLHEQGVIHRDIKPSNILIDGNGQPVIIDLGIATLLTGDALETLTTDGVPIGSPAFMSPEQARGERHRISTRTDVYGLGATGYVLLTGKTPHDLDTTIHEAVRRVAQEPARAPRSLEPGLPRALAAVLEKAVSGGTESRYASAAELAADLSRWLAGESVLAVPAGLGRRAARWIGRHPVLATTAASCVLAACIVGAAIVGVWWAGTRASALVIDPDPTAPRWVEVRSLAGSALRRWEMSPGAGAPVAIQLERATEFGGGKLFIIATDLTARDPYAGRLCAYEPRDLWQPVWSSQVGPPGVMMPPLEGFTAAPRFECEMARAADVFPESPGDEIIAVVRHHQWAPAMVRVYDAGGEVLFEAWHNGWVSSVAWLPGARLLVLLAANSEVTWFGRGVSGVQPLWPTVVMAVRPELRRRGGWIQTPTMQGDVRPEWYRCILPPEALDPGHMGGGATVSAGATGDSPSTFRLVVGDVEMYLDEHCRETRDRFVFAHYHRTGDRPDPQTYFQLGDLPPIDPARGASARPANRD